MILNKLRLCFLAQLMFISALFLTIPLSADQDTNIDKHIIVDQNKIFIGSPFKTEEQVLQALAKAPATITEITILADYWETKLTVKTLHYIRDHYPNLRDLYLCSLDIDNDVLPQAMLSFPHLERLTIGTLYKEYLDDRGATAFALACPNLQWLTIGHGPISDEALESFLKLCPDIQYLVLGKGASKFPLLSDSSLKAMEVYGKNLKIVRFTYTSALTNEGIKSFLSTCNSEIAFTLHEYPDNPAQIIPEEILELAHHRYFDFQYYCGRIVRVSSSPTQQPVMEILYLDENFDIIRP